MSVETESPRVNNIEVRPRKKKEMERKAMENEKVIKIRREILKTRILERTEAERNANEEKINKQRYEIADFLVVVKKDYGLANEKWNDVSQLVDKAEEDSDTGRRAKECLEDLTTAVWAEMRQSNDPVVKEALKNGMASMEGILPEGLEDIAQDIFVKEVPNEQIRVALNIIDSEKHKNKIEGKSEDDIPVAIINMAKEKLKEAKIEPEEAGILNEAVIKVDKLERKVVPIIQAAGNEPGGQPDGRRGKERYDERESYDREKITLPDGTEMEIPQRSFDLDPRVIIDLIKDGKEMIRIGSTPPDFFKNLPKDDQEELKAVFEMHNEAVRLYYAGNGPFDKLRNPNLKFSGEDLQRIYTPGVKEATKYILQDLCEPKVTRYGNTMMVYKTKEEQVYWDPPANTKPKLVDGKPVMKINIDTEVMKKLNDLSAAKEEWAFRIAKARYNKDRQIKMDGNYNDLVKNGQIVSMKELVKDPGKEDDGTVVVLKQGVDVDRIKREGLKDEDFLFKVTWSDRIDAATAWQAWVVSWGSSLADEYRILPPTPGVVSDKIRTLNAMAKFYKKLRLWAKGEMMSEEVLEEAEWFGGSIAIVLQKIMLYESKSGRAIDGKKTLKQKINDGEFKIFSDPICFGAYDIMDNESGSVMEMVYSENASDEEKNKKWTMAEALYYGKDVSFKKKSQDVWGDIRDSEEQAIDNLLLMMGGKSIEKGKFDKWLIDARTSTGLANSIKVKGERLFRFTKSPEFWAMVLANSIGVRTDLMGIDCFYLQGEYKNYSYDDYVKSTVNALNLDSTLVDIKAVEKLLGYKGDFLSTLREFNLSKSRNQLFLSRAEKWGVEAKRIELREKIQEQERENDWKEDLQRLFRSERIEDKAILKEFQRLKTESETAIERGDEVSFRRLIAEMKKLLEGSQQQPSLAEAS